MQISLETTGALERRLTIAVPADRLEKAFSDRIRGLSKNVKMPGFRPGHVPLKMVEAQYGPQIMQEVAGALIQSTFQEAVGQEKLRPAGGPSIEPKTLSRGKDLEYVATFEVYPDVNKLDIKGARIERPVCEVIDEDVDRTLETMRKQRLEWRPVDRAAAEGDKLEIDFLGRIDGEPFAGGEAKDFAVELGSKALIGDFESQLTGAAAGDTRTVTVTFPDEYANPDLAGKTAEFEVQVNQVMESQLPEINEEFAKAFGVAEGGVARLREEVKANLETEMEDRVRQKTRDAVMEALLTANDIELPKHLVDEEIGRLIQSNKEMFQRQGIDPEQLPDNRELYESTARRRVALGLILADIAAARKISADPARVRAALERMAAAYEDPDEFIRWHMADQRRLGEVQATVMEQMIVEELLQEAEAVDVPVSFVELMQTSPTADNQEQD